MNRLKKLRNNQPRRLSSHKRREPQRHEGRKGFDFSFVLFVLFVPLWFIYFS
jgi:hypothetical protein